jgi:hypothetical protein
MAIGREKLRMSSNSGRAKEKVVPKKFLCCLPAGL